MPDEAIGTGRAAAMIGQGKVQASPMAMAAVAASVRPARRSSRTWSTDEADVQGGPLTASEADQLESMMRAVVTEGSGRVLADLPGRR